MAKQFAAHVQAKRRRAAFHEASHIEVTKAVAPEATIYASVNDYGSGDATTLFPPGTTRQNKLLVAVAGFLGEAKGHSEKTLSDDRIHARVMAADIDRRLRAGEDKFQVDVLMTDGETEMSTTNNRDFAFLLEDLQSKKHNFRAFFGLDSWANEIQDAILDCIARLNTEAVWGAVGDTANHILEHGWYSTEE
jgi:hypothetical protein